MEQKTLKFRLIPKNEEQIEFSVDEILEQIGKQKEEFTKKHGYEPKYIELSIDLYKFLFYQFAMKNIIKLTTNKSNALFGIYGMIIRMSD